MTLFKLHLSPFTHKNLQNLLPRLTSEDAVLLTQDAVYTLKHSLLNQLKDLNVDIYTLQEDMIARGIDQSDIGKTINYQQMVDLVLKYDNNVSW